MTEHFYVDIQLRDQLPSASIILVLLNWLKITQNICVFLHIDVRKPGLMLVGSVIRCNSSLEWWLLVWLQCGSSAPMFSRSKVLCPFHSSLHRNKSPSSWMCPERAGCASLRLGSQPSGSQHLVPVTVLTLSVRTLRATWA